MIFVNPGVNVRVSFFKVFLKDSLQCKYSLYICIEQNKKTMTNSTNKSIESHPNFWREEIKINSDHVVYTVWMGEELVMRQMLANTMGLDAFKVLVNEHNQTLNNA